MSRLPELSIREAAIAWGTAVNDCRVNKRTKPLPHMVTKNSLPGWVDHPRTYETECDIGIGYNNGPVCPGCVAAANVLYYWENDQRAFSRAVARAQTILLRAIAREAGDADNLA